MDPHVHCAVCHQAIATTKKSPSGHRVDVEVDLVAEPVLLPGPNGQIVGMQRQRPACPECIGQLTAAQEEAKKPSGLVIARPGMPL